MYYAKKTFSITKKYLYNTKNKKEKKERKQRKEKIRKIFV